MNTKRNRRKIWHLIDSIMLALPLLFLFGSFLIMLVQQRNLSDGVGNYWSYDNIISILDNVLNDVTYEFDFIIENGDGFNNMLFSVIEDFFNFFDTATSNVKNFITHYLTYCVMYEFLSLFINIILWLPRYFRDKLLESGD